MNTAPRDAAAKQSASQPHRPQTVLLRLIVCSVVMLRGAWNSFLPLGATSAESDQAHFTLRTRTKRFAVNTRRRRSVETDLQFEHPGKLTWKPIYGSNQPAD